MDDVAEIGKNWYVCVCVCVRASGYMYIHQGEDKVEGNRNIKKEESWRRRCREQDRKGKERGVKEGGNRMVCEG